MWKISTTTKNGVIKKCCVVYSKKIKKEILTFGNTKIKNCKFQYCKYPIGTKDIEIDIIMASNNTSFSKKGLRTVLVLKMMKKLGLCI